MKTPTAIPGFTFTKEPYTDLVARFLAIPWWTPTLLGNSSDGHPIYAFTYGDLSKPVMHVEGNIHGGHEWRTCWWVSEFMRLLHDPSALASDTVEAIEDLKARYAFSFIPSCNPDGYVINEYKNGNGVNLNRNFDYNWTLGPSDPANVQYRGPAPFSEVETQYIRDWVQALKPVSFMDNHTWSSTNEGFTTLVPQLTAQRPLVAEFHENVMKAVGMWPDGFAPHNETAPAGLAGNWGSVTTSALGETPISITFESGGGWAVEQQSRVGMTAILYHMLSVDAALFPPIPTRPPAVAVSWGPYRRDGVEYAVARVDAVVDGELREVWVNPAI